MQSRPLLIYLLGLISFSLYSQNEVMHNINMQASYLFEVPAGDLSDRYGNNSKFEFKFEYLTAKQFAYYIKAGIRINQNVKEDVLASIRTEEGFVIGVNGFYADVFGRKRGYDIGVGIDKLLPLGVNNLRMGLSAAFVTHWVKLVDDSRALPQLIDESSQLFDRFVSGFGIEENVQYQFNMNSNRSALLLGIQVGQFFTKEHRYKLIGPESKERRLDLYFGLKLSYLLPLKSFEEGGTIYY